MKDLLSSIIVFALLIPVVAIATADSDAPSTSSNDHPIERAALMSLYDSTYGEFWYENEGWGSDGSYCEWFGVTCDPSGHVQELDLPDNTLDGPIPSQIEGLVALQGLDLSGTLIWDPLPEELGNLAQLQILDLSDNEYCMKGCGRSLGGAIPASLGDLSNLQTLDLSDNVLEGVIPDQLGDLAQLQTLDLSGNRFCRTDYHTGEMICNGGLYGVIPANLSNLSALETLSLQDNKSLCWETIAARSWALTLPLYSGPTDCSYLPLFPHLAFAKSAGSGSLTFVISADPRDGTGFAFDLSGPANPTTPTLLNNWGSYGSGDGQFWYPTAVALDTTGSVYVVDTGNRRIQKFDKNGAYLSHWGSEGNAGGQFNAPRGVGVDTAGSVYVADTGNHRIQKFDNHGDYLRAHLKIIFHVALVHKNRDPDCEIGLDRRAYMP